MLGVFINVSNIYIDIQKGNRECVYYNLQFIWGIRYQFHEHLLHIIILLTSYVHLCLYNNSHTTLITAKRDALCAAEIEVQAMWEKEKAFECNPIEGSTGTTDDKFIVTFPYPYSNGHLHLGHAFSLTKAVFRAQFERNRGKNSLFPFAFHCTGMPIQAVSVVYPYYHIICTRYQSHLIFFQSTISLGCQQTQI